MRKVDSNAAMKRTGGVAIDIFYLLLNVKSLNTRYIKTIKVNLMHDNYGEASVKSVNTNMFMVKFINSACLSRKENSYVSY